MDEVLSGDVIQSLLKVRASKPALYTCLASNRHSAGANTVKASARVTVAGRFGTSYTQASSGCLCGWLQLLVPPAGSGFDPHTLLSDHTHTPQSQDAEAACWSSAPDLD